jgi:hypothetical protein
MSPISEPPRVGRMTVDFFHLDMGPAPHLDPHHQRSERNQRRAYE